ncbi:MAG: hypothetical protein HY711_09145 [Candidatus Melainabacteria bacterium]|nr:hypothetical protein [Candidatus Melainabacteria bacterium]
MPGTAVGLIFIDFIVRPFAKIFEKMPILMIAMLVIFYGIIAYIVLRSAYLVDKQ